MNHYDKLLIQSQWVSSVIEWFEPYAGGLWINPPGWLPLLNASLNVPIGLGDITSANAFTQGTNREMKGRAQGFPCEIFPGNKNNCISQLATVRGLIRIYDSGHLDIGLQSGFWLI